MEQMGVAIVMERNSAWLRSVRVEVDVDEQRGYPADTRREREALPVRGSERPEPEEKRGEGHRENAREGVLEADRKDDDRGIDEEVPARVAEDRVPGERRDECRETGNEKHTSATLPEHETNGDDSDDRGENGAVGNLCPVEHQPAAVGAMIRSSGRPPLPLSSGK